jgi:hypothetical protein
MMLLHLILMADIILDAARRTIMMSIAEVIIID